MHAERFVQLPTDHRVANVLSVVAAHDLPVAHRSNQKSTTKWQQRPQHTCAECFETHPQSRAAQRSPQSHPQKTPESPIGLEEVRIAKPDSPSEFGLQE
jgi:hypothetical protein